MSLKLNKWSCLTMDTNDMKNYIEQCLCVMKEGYRNDPNRINSDYNKETESIQSYHGRELLELLQNADDELRDDMPREVYISFKDNVLSIANYGEL